MIMSVREFSCSCVCRSYAVDGYLSACNSFSYDFSPGTYVLQGEIDCGAWAFVSSISDYCTQKSIFPPSEIFLDGEKMEYGKVGKVACYLSKDLHNAFGYLKKNAYDIIEKSAAKTGYPLSADELFDLFGIPKESAQKRVSDMGYYYLAFVAMEGMIRGEKIFTTAWQGQYGFDGKVLMQVGNALTKNGCILIIPSSEKNVFGGSVTPVKMLSLFSEELKRKYGLN